MNHLQGRMSNICLGLMKTGCAYKSHTSMTMLTTVASLFRYTAYARLLLINRTFLLNSRYFPSSQFKN